MLQQFFCGFLQQILVSWSRVHSWLGFCLIFDQIQTEGYGFLSTSWSRKISPWHNTWSEAKGCFVGFPQDVWGSLRRRLFALKQTLRPLTGIPKWFIFGGFSSQGPAACGLFSCSQEGQGKRQQETYQDGRRRPRHRRSRNSADFA